MGFTGPLSRGHLLTMIAARALTLCRTPVFGLFAMLLAAQSAQADEPLPARTAPEPLQSLAQVEATFEPERAVFRGLPAMALAGLAGDRSQAARERMRLLRIEALADLERMPAGTLAVQRARRAYRAAVDIAAQGCGRVSLGEARPYAVDHLSGAWADVPASLIALAPPDTLEAADAALARLAALPAAIEDERRRLLFEARPSEGGRDCRPPRRALVLLAEATGRWADLPVERNPVYRHLARALLDLEAAPPSARLQRLEALRALLSGPLADAYRGLSGTARSLGPDARDMPGLYAVIDGDDQYDRLLALHADPGMPAEEVRRAAQTALEARQAELQAAVAALEAELGLVAAAVEAPGGDAASDTDAPAPPPLHARLDAVLRALEEAEARASDAAAPEAGDVAPPAPSSPFVIQQALATRFARGAKGRLVRIDWPSLLPDPGWAGRYVAAPAASGRRGVSGVALPELHGSGFDHARRVHAGVPGRHWALRTALEYGGETALDRLTRHEGFVAGWGAYAEALAAEAGLFDDDPRARLGYLQARALHAARALADVDLHRFRVGHSEASAALSAATGLAPDASDAEIDRIMVWPGDAAAAFAGEQVLSALHDRARAVLGPQFDEAAFHHQVLVQGPRPLDMLQEDIEAWYGAQIPQ